MAPRIVSAKIVHKAESLAERADYIGLCLECEAETCQVEPDARGYLCDVCGAKAVYGAEEIVIRWGGV